MTLVKEADVKTRQLVMVGVALVLGWGVLIDGLLILNAVAVVIHGFRPPQDARLALMIVVWYITAPVQLLMLGGLGAIFKWLIRKKKKE